MSPLKRYTFWIDDAQAAALTAVQARDGILPSEQIRRALDEWLAKQGVAVKKAARKRAATRRRA